MSRPIVAVVGRPNVGKSTLFNRLAGERISIVQDTPGVTRDRIYADVEWLDRKFTLIDTGGMEIGSEEVIQKQIVQQAQIAIETADVILFVTDVKTGVTEDDVKVANLLRRTKKPVVLAVNKVDSVKRDTLAIYEFYELGIGDPLPVSAGQALGLGDMLDQIIANFPEKDIHEEEDDAIKVAIIGKPNVGKSSLINGLMNRKSLARTSAQPGKTQTINYYNVNDEIYFVDLPGYGYAQANENVKAQWGKMIEDYLHKSKQLKLVFLLIDIRHAPSENDRIMYDWIRRNGYDPIIIATKLDKINRSQIQKQIKLIRTTLQAGADTQIIPYSAQTKQGREEIYEILDGVLAAENPAQE